MAWNQTNRNAAPRKRRSPIWRRGLLAGLIVVVGVVVWLLLAPKSRSTEPDSKPSKRTRIATVPHVVATNAATKASESVATAPTKPTEPPYEKRPGQMKLPSGKILTFPPPMEGQIRKVYADGRLYECDHLGNFKDVTKRKLFKSAFELNFLGLAQEGKSYIPVFLKGLDEDAVRKMLTKPYVPLGDETEEEQASLKAYDDMRSAALMYMDNGGKFDDFVDEFAQFDLKQRETRAMGLREVMMLYKQGKVAEAKEMAEAASVLMEKNGFKPIHLPPHVKAAFDELPEQ